MYKKIFIFLYGKYCNITSFSMRVTYRLCQTMSCCIALQASIGGLSSWIMSHPPWAFTAGLGVVFLGSEVKKQGTVVCDKRSVQGIVGRGPSVPPPRDGSRLWPLHRPFRCFSLLNLTRLCLSSALDWLLDVQRAPVEGPKRVRLPLFQLGESLVGVICCLGGWAFLIFPKDAIYFISSISMCFDNRHDFEGAQALLLPLPFSRSL